MVFNISPVAGTIISAIDSFGARTASVVRSDQLTPFMELTSEIFEPMIVLVVSCLIVAYLLIKKMRFDAWRFLISIIGISAFVWLGKNLIARDRPFDGVIPETGFSFPSGHAAVSVVFFYILYLTIRPHIRNLAIRRIYFIFSLTMPVFIGMSRIYLGVHYLSDVLAGFIFGAITVSIAILCSGSYERKIG